MRWLAVPLVSCLAVAGTGCDVTTCNWTTFADYAAIERTDEGTASVAWHVTALRREASTIDAGYEGTLANLDPHTGGTALLRRFLAPPSPDDLSGGETRAERFLPTAGEHTFVIPLEANGFDVPLGDEAIEDLELDEWVVIEILDASSVEVEIQANVQRCQEGNRTPPLDATWERAW